MISNEDVICKFDLNTWIWIYRTSEYQAGSASGGPSADRPPLLRSEAARAAPMSDKDAKAAALIARIKTTEDYYKILGVEKTADDSAVRPASDPTQLDFQGRI